MVELVPVGSGSLGSAVARVMVAGVVGALRLYNGGRLSDVVLRHGAQRRLRYTLVCLTLAPSRGIRVTFHWL